MPVCPKCGKEIDHLINVGKTQYYFSLDGKGYPQYETIDALEDGKYYCPKCLEELFDSERDATKFLKGEMKVA